MVLTCFVMSYSERITTSNSGGDTMKTTSKHPTFTPGQRVRVVSYAGGTEFTGLVGTIASQHPVAPDVFKVELLDQAPIWSKASELERVEANGE